MNLLPQNANNYKFNSIPILPVNYQLLHSNLKKPPDKILVRSKNSSVSKKQKLSLQLSTDSNESGFEVSDAVKLALELKNNKIRKNSKHNVAGQPACCPTSNKQQQHAHHPHANAKHHNCCGKSKNSSSEHDSNSEIDVVNHTSDTDGTDSAEVDIDGPIESSPTDQIGRSNISERDQQAVKDLLSLRNAGVDGRCQSVLGQVTESHLNQSKSENLSVVLARQPRQIIQVQNQIQQQVQILAPIGPMAPPSTPNLQNLRQNQNQLLTQAHAQLTHGTHGTAAIGPNHLQVNLPNQSTFTTLNTYNTLINNQIPSPQNLQLVSPSSRQVIVQNYGGVNSGQVGLNSILQGQNNQLALEQLRLKNELNRVQTNIQSNIHSQSLLANVLKDRNLLLLHQSGLLNSSQYSFGN